jgi:hypothetical protein
MRNWRSSGATSKYGNKPRRCGAGHFHQSGLEAGRCAELQALQSAGLIRDLEQQPRYRLDVNDVHICDYIADFRYHDVQEDATVVEDAKGVATDVYKIKKCLVLAIHGVEVMEIRRVRGSR